MKKAVLLIAALACFTLTEARVRTASVDIGDYEGSTTMVEGSYFDVAPTSFYLAHTGSQILYTADDLLPLTYYNDVHITKLTFRYANFDAYDTMTRRVRVYLQPTTATEFAKVEGVKQFFDFDHDDPIFDVTYDYQLIDTYCQDGELELDVSDLPFAFDPWQGMILTVVMDAVDDDNCLNSGFDLQFYSTGRRSRAMTYTNNHISFVNYKATSPDFPDATALLGCGTNIDQPVTRIEFTYDNDDNTPGDVNGDGTADVEDINIIVNAILSHSYDFDADINGDGKIDIQDLNDLINIILGA